METLSTSPAGVVFQSSWFGGDDDRWAICCEAHDGRIARCSRDRAGKDMLDPSPKGKRRGEGLKGEDELGDVVYV